MAPQRDDEHGGLSRRDLLIRVGAVGAFAVAGPVKASAQAEAREALETFTAAEASIVEAIVERLIPTDENGPGAREARAAHYIDRALGGALSSSREAYRAGLEAVDRYARQAKGASFTTLPAQAQDAVLKDMEANVATGFVPNSASFFELLRAHTMQGTFSDPYYGGNANFVGWDLIGYPGVRVAVSPEDQRMDAHPAPTHKSAYDYAMFSKRRPARAAIDEPTHHGD
jgi:gluconate 2-dehydrogenase gamma chain